MKKCKKEKQVKEDNYKKTWKICKLQIEMMKERNVKQVKVKLKGNSDVKEIKKKKETQSKMKSLMKKINEKK